MGDIVSIGTSGWDYPGWKDIFYAGVSKKKWLSHCSGKFTGIEVNATFYGMQKFSTFKRWHEETPPDFRFAIKGNKYLTHNKKLKDPEEPLFREKERALGLGEKLAAVLWQLPGNFKKNIVRLSLFAHQLSQWNETRHVIEFRHPSWFDNEVAECLSRNRIGICTSDAADWPMWDMMTTDLVYVRLHGHTRTYASAYETKELTHWGERVLEWHQKGYDVHVYFDNDAEGAAPYNAMQLLEIVRRHQLFYTGQQGVLG